MENTSKKNAIKNYNFHEHLCKGSYVDARDVQGNWRVAKIIQRDEKYVTIRFDAWESRYDEQLHINSVRIAPFRKFTDGYTGPIRKTIRDTPLRIESLQQHKSRLQSFLKSDSLQYSAQDVNQYLRGEFLITTDSLLTFPCDLETDQVKTIFEFLESAVGFVVKFCDKCLLLASTNFEDYLSGKDSFLYNQKVAQLSALQQVLYTLMLIFVIRGEPRNKLYLQNGKKLDWSLIYNTQQFSNPIQHLRKEFAKKKGYDRIKKIFLYRDQNTGKGFWASVRKYCLLIHHQSKQKLNLPLLQPKDYAETYKLIPAYLQFFPKQETEIAVLQYSLNLSLGNYPFEAKLKGMNEFKSYLDKIKSKSIQNPFKFVAQDRLLMIIKKLNFLEILIDGKNFNSQIFKRASPIINFIAQRKSLTSDHILSIFKLAQNRHESQIILIYGVIAQLASFSSVQFLDFMFDEMLKLKMNEFKINLMKQFTIKAIQNLMNQTSFLGSIFRRKKNSPKHNYYGINVLWKEIQDQGSLDVKFLQHALDALKNLFSNDIFKSTRQTFLVECLENIKKKKSFGQSMKLFLNILSAYNVSAYIGQSRGDVVTKLDKKYQILEIATQGLKKQYLKISHQQSLQYFFEFLQEYNNNLKVGLKIENIKNLWKMDTNMLALLNFLRKQRSSEEKQYKRKYIKRISLELIEQLFTHIFLQPNLMSNFQINPQIYDTVDELYLSFHINHKNLELSDKQILRLIRSVDFGIQFYQRVLLNQKNKGTLYEKAKKRYVQLHLRLKDHNDIQKRLQIWVKLFDSFFVQLRKNNKAILPVMLYFLKEIQGKMIRENVTQPGYLDLGIKVEEQPIKIVRIAKNSTIYKLRKVIMEQFNIESDFTMEVIEGSKQISFLEEQDYSVNAIEIGKGPSIRVYMKKGKHPHITVLETFKQKISNKSDVYNTLLELLEKNIAQKAEVWEILQILPKNRNLIDKLELIENEFNNEKWKKFFEDKNFEKLLYKLKLLNGFLEKKAWIESFIKTQGFSTLTSRVLGFEKKSLLAYPKVVSLSLAIIYSCMNNTKWEDLEIDSEVFFTKLMQYVNSLSSEAGIGNNNYTQLFNSCTLLFEKMLTNKNNLTKLFFKDEQNFIKKWVLHGATKASYNDAKNFNESFMQIYIFYLSIEDRYKLIEELISQYLTIGFISKQDSQAFINLLIELIHSFSEEQYNILISKQNNIESYLQSFSDSILFDPKQSEKDEKYFNQLIYASLRMKNLLIQKKSAIALELEDLTQLLIKQYLFHESQLSTSRVKTQKNIHQLYILLNSIFKANPSLVKIISEHLIPKLKKGKWRKNSYMDWMIEVERNERKIFCGLKNLRATCYINCLLQQFYMIQPFRESILNISSEEYKEDPKDNQILKLQQILTFLKYSSKGSYNPRQFLEAFKDYEGKSIDVGVQSDVDEFFNAFMEKLQNFLKFTDKTQIVDNTFRGISSNQLICEGKHESERQQNYLSLGVNIKNKNSLEQALKEYISGEVLDGQNAYYCQKCEKKVKTLKRLCIKSLPNILIVVLKRFEFNYDTMKKIKVNDYCSFPLDLNMKNYTSEFLKEKEQDKVFMEQDYYKYKLRGVVVHYGSAEAGHYYSYIKNQKEWFEFNDQMISTFNINDLAQETFGGTQTFGNHEMENIKTQKCKNAYLLFYERDNYYNSNNEKIEIKVKPNQYSNKLRELVISDDSNHEFLSVMFSHQFYRFIVNIDVKHNFEEIKLIFIYFHVVILRSRDKEEFILPFSKKIQDCLSNVQGCAQWYFDQINKDFIKQFLLDPPRMVRYIVTGFVMISIDKVKEFKENQIKILMSCLEKKGMTPYAKIFYKLSTRKQAKQLLEQLNYPEIIINIIISDAPQKIQNLVYEIIENQFGVQSETKQKQRDFCSISLLQSLSNFDISIQNIDKLYLKVNSKQSFRILCKLLLKKTDTLVELEKLLPTICQKIKSGDQRQIKYYIYWFKYLFLIEDDIQAERISFILPFFLQLFPAFETTYYPFENLLKYLFQFGFKIKIFKQKLIEHFEKNPKALETIKNWISKSGSVLKLIYHDEWTVYKKKIGNNLPENSSYYIDLREKREIKLQRILTKQFQPNVKLIESDDEFANINMSVATEQIVIKNGHKNFSKIRVMNRVGLLYQISVDGILKWYIGDKDQIQFYNSVQ